MHHDESLHAFHSWQLSEGLGLIHNPMMHGPLQMELTAGIFFLFGDSDFTARLIYVLAGSLLTLMPFLFRSSLGRTGGVITSLLFAISPALLYFSRFARNDILMAVFTFGIIVAMWKYLETSKVKYLYFFTGLLALSFGTKESAYLISG
ncbi:MAG: flippase activity-associated protein Agl23, partial [Dehalococcoidia bacterium]